MTGSKFSSADKTGKIECLNDLDESLTYSYANYLTWLFDDRVELIRGKIFKMSPAPSQYHQEVSLRISSFLFNFLRYKSCKVYTAPFDVRFPKESREDKDIYTVLQPDICVVCDPAELDARGCLGAPDIVVEILSPGNNKVELLHKYSVYEQFQVKEYWVVSISDKAVLKYTLDERANFRPSKLFTLSEKVHSDVIPGFELELDEVFEGV